MAECAIKFIYARLNLPVAGIEAPALSRSLSIRTVRNRGATARLSLAFACNTLSSDTLLSVGRDARASATGLLQGEMKELWTRSSRILRKQASSTFSIPFSAEEM